MKKKSLHESHGASTTATILRELSKGNFKDALKDAKVYYRKDSSEPNRQLLQRAHIFRARELFQNELMDQAQQCLKEASQLGTVSDELKSDFGQLSVMLGLEKVGTNGSSELDSKAMRAMADHAVISVALAKNLPPDARQGAESVRAALLAIEHDQLDEANRLLADIDRDSDFLDWKLFARGLAAYYRRDDQKMIANWDRLDPVRAAYRIAQPLIAISGCDKSRSVSPQVQIVIGQLEQQVLDSRISTHLKAIAREHEAERWGAMALHVRDLVHFAGESDRGLVRQVVEVLWQRLVKDADYESLEKLIRFAPGPPLDPNWNRARALFEEHREDRGLAECGESWLNYIKDLDQCDALNDNDRQLAKGLVYARLAANDEDAALGAEQYAKYSEEAALDLAEFQRQAASFYELSLQHAPVIREIYQPYAKLLDRLRESHRSLEILEAFCERFPDDYQGLLSLAGFCLARKLPGKARAPAAKALSLRPRDTTAAGLLRMANFAIARNAILAGDLALARVTLDEADIPSLSEAFSAQLGALRVMIEFKSGNVSVAEKSVTEISKRFDQPSAGLLLVAAEAGRCGLSTDITKSLNEGLRNAIKKKCGSQAAGVMASYLQELEVEAAEYRDLAAHGDIVLKYLGRCTKVKWRASDLVSVCSFLLSYERDGEVFSRMLSAAKRQFPSDPHFPAIEALAELRMGPRHLNQRFARECLDRAMKLSKTSDHPLDEQYAASVRRGLSLLDDLRDRKFHPRFGSNRFGEYDDDDDDEYDKDGPNPQLDSMPESIRRIVEELAQKMGIDVNELVDRFKSGDLFDLEDLIRTRSGSKS